MKKMIPVTKNGTLQCGKCATPLFGGEKYCGGCGVPIQWVIEREIKNGKPEAPVRDEKDFWHCGICGNILLNYGTARSYCTECGNEVDWELANA